MPDQAPQFKFEEDGISVDDLNKVSKAAFRKFEIEGGGGVEFRDGTWIFTIPRRGTEIRVRVYPETEDSYGSTSGSGPSDKCPNKIAHRWVEQKPGDCNTWTDDPMGRSGAINKDPAYEATGVSVSAGYLTIIRPAQVKIDSSTSPPKVIQEWVFDAGGTAGGQVFTFIDCVSFIIEDGAD